MKKKKKDVTLVEIIARAFIVLVAIAITIGVILDLNESKDCKDSGGEVVEKETALVIKSTGEDTAEIVYKEKTCEK